MNAGPYRVTLDETAAEVLRFLAKFAAGCLAMAAVAFGIGVVVFVWFDVQPLISFREGGTPWYAIAAMNGAVVLFIVLYSWWLCRGAVNIEKAES